LHKADPRVKAHKAGEEQAKQDKKDARKKYRDSYIRIPAVHSFR